MAQTTGRTSFWSPVLARVTQRFVAAMLILVGLAVFAVPALAAEQIRSFTTNTTLRVDGSVDVVETIEVNAEGSQIRRGIYRDIPTTLINDDKSRLRSDLDVVAVLKDGVPEPYSVENIGNGFKRIRIGDADVFLDYRVYRYTIHYTMSRMARFFADHDELYWNATGNYWDFPILKATATLNLPAGAVTADAIGYTGTPGSQEQAVEIVRTSGVTTTFRSTRVLSPGEGMSVAVKFQKGILVEPQGLTGLGNWLSDHREIVFPSVAVLIVLLYNLFAWNAVGRDPQKGTIIPLFHPPAEMSPAVVHYVNRMGFKQSGWTAFIASIFDLGVKGLVTIDKAGGKTKITATNASPNGNLPSGESSVYSFLHSRGTVTIDKTDGPKLNEKRGELVSTIQSENRAKYFKNNAGYTAIGVVLAILLLGALVLLDVLEPVYLVVAVVAAIAVGVVIGVASGARSGNIVGKVIGFVWVAIIGVNVLGSSVSMLSGIRFDTGLVAATSIIVIEIVFAILMRAPTVAGRKLMDQIEGFKMYLETAEKNRLNYVDKGEPVMTITRFEAILPFAIALAVEKPWSQRFEADLARNAVADAQGGHYSPLWYTGTDWSSSSSGFSNTVSSMATGMSAAMIAAQPSSSSGSGFSGGGGGGSGGGGGGGGGGGW
ncbi:MAG: DUF2207 domain-containing protein [Devosia nanyangense]|uniref:DUF2207 domain-containing protein n=1 Tax=Devosia nanyangense TaxID=1228055 RepID=A0A933L4V2_9HYPH|nr:DUF2207 domain-containing protein [Devosia nanyangense]